MQISIRQGSEIKFYGDGDFRRTVEAENILCRVRRRRILELSDDKECGKFRLAALKPTRPLHATALLNLKFYRAIGQAADTNKPYPQKAACVSRSPCGRRHIRCAARHLQANTALGADGSITATICRLSDQTRRPRKHIAIASSPSR